MNTTFAIILTVIMATAPTSPLLAAERAPATTRITDFECFCRNHPAKGLTPSAALAPRRVKSLQQTPTAQPKPIAKVGGRVSRRNLIIVTVTIAAFWIFLAIQPET